ncbi:MAG: hypothetical protein LBN26_04490 [Christensenellaceae bacterium]|jgi:hypothetical protein|nr:hypothetical protein [Christensenellaceae bacterium]
MYKQKRLLACALLLAILLVCAFPMTAFAAAFVGAEQTVNGVPEIKLTMVQNSNVNAAGGPLLWEYGNKALDLEFTLNFSDIAPVVQGVANATIPLTPDFSAHPSYSLLTNSISGFSGVALISGTFTATVTLSSNLTVNQSVLDLTTLPPGDPGLQALLTSQDLRDVFQVESISVVTTGNPTITGVASLKPGVTGSTLNNASILGPLTAMTFSLPNALTVKPAMYNSAPLVNNAVKVDSSAEWGMSVPGNLAPTVENLLFYTFGVPRPLDNAPFVALPMKMGVGEKELYLGVRNDDDDDDDDWTPPTPLPYLPPKTGGSANAAWLLYIAGGVAMVLACTALRKKQGN